MAASTASPSRDDAHSAPAAAQVRAWLLPVAAWRGQWPALAGMVQASQYRRFASIRCPRRRQERLLAAALHRRVLSRALGLAQDALPLYRDALGGPRLALPGHYTSLAHTDGVIAVALSVGGPVGIDVEGADADSLWPIADLVCAPGELPLARNDAGTRQGLLELWVRKEAALKAVGIGLSRPMASFAAPADETLCLRDLQGRQQALVVRRIEGVEGVVAAVAAPPGARIRWRWLRPDDIEVLD